MKIVCEACQAKYSIADEKVRGKVFKIRCKKCSHVIVVRGSGEAASGASGEFASSPSSAPDLALDAGWHIVVEGEQVGPLSEGDIRARLARGEITHDTYIWKEGLADWVKISTLAEFAGGEMETASPFSGGEDAGGFAGSSTMVSSSPPAEMFASPSASAGASSGGAAMPDSFAAPAGGSLGGASAGASYGGGYEAPTADPFAPMGAAGNGASGAGMTGQRHENSVLFSLSNLEALAKPNSASALPASVSRSPGAAPGFASTTTEGSGLIDIRAMANMTLGAAAAKNENKGNDLPAFSAPQFSPVAPVLLAPGSGSGTPRWAIIALLSFFGVVAIVLTAVAVKLLTDKPAPAVVQAPPAAALPPAATAPAGTAVPAAEKVPPVTPPPAANEDLPPREAKPASASSETGTRVRPSGSSGSRRPGARASADPGDRASGAVTPTPRQGSEPAPRKPPKDDIEALLEAAAGKRAAGGGGSSSGSAARREEDDSAKASERLPPLPREEVVKGMNAVLPKARDCYSQYKVPGSAMVKVTVAPTGRVSNALVSGKFAGTPSGTCVESAVKTARFAPSAGLTFDYPIPLR